MEYSFQCTSLSNTIPKCVNFPVLKTMSRIKQRMSSYCFYMSSVAFAFTGSGDLEWVPFKADVISG